MARYCVFYMLTSKGTLATIFPRVGYHTTICCPVWRAARQRSVGRELLGLRSGYSRIASSCTGLDVCGKPLRYSLLRSYYRLSILTRTDLSSEKATDIPTRYENIQLLELRNGQHTQSTPSFQNELPVPLPAVSSNRPTPSASDSAYDRIIASCQCDFRSCPWYLDNQYFIISFIVGAAPVYLAFAASNLEQLNVYFVQYACSLLGGCCLCLSTIPLCGVLSTIERTRSKRRAFSIIRIIVDPGWAYRICRRVYYYTSPGLVVLSVIVAFKNWIFILRFPGIFVAFCTWIVFYMPPFLLSVFGAMYSLYWYV